MLTVDPPLEKSPLRRLFTFHVVTDGRVRPPVIRAPPNFRSIVATVTNIVLRKIF